MFVFGHLGFGHQLAAPWRARLPAIPLAVGMLLPDLLDKPLYYAAVSDVISSTRTFGHSGLLCLGLAALAMVLDRRWPTALAAGMLTHIVLDFAIDWAAGNSLRVSWLALTWPVNGVGFGTVHIASMRDHARRLINGWMIAAELIGLVLVAREWRAARSRTSRLSPPPRHS